MEYLCTICSKRKRRDPGLLPASHRYLSRRIRFVTAETERLGRPLLILSGRYGLLEPGDAIPWYDHLLSTSAFDVFVPLLVSQLGEKNATAICLYGRPRATAGWEAYYSALGAATRLRHVRLAVHTLGPEFP